MRCRLWVTAVVASALLASGCSGDKPAPPSTAKFEAASATTQTSASAIAAPAEPTSAEAPPPAVATLDGDACVEITGANLDLAVATNPGDARKAADTFEKYNPPADVKDAIEHFASTGGAQSDDPDYDKYNSLIDNWVKQVCPL
jgi:outer membrane murein-binding lipoprotein Lpp